MKPITHCPSEAQSLSLIKTYLSENPEAGESLITPGSWREFIQWAERYHRCLIVHSSLGGTAEWGNPTIYVMQFLSEKSFTLFLLRHS